MQKTTFFLALLLISCGTTKQVSTIPKETKQSFIFDYTPKESAKLGSASMVLAFIRPQYAADFSLSSNELLQNFRKGLSGDIEELIISKGFTLKGPYTARDEMVFEDKKRVEMDIEIDIAPTFSYVQGDWTDHYHSNLLSPSSSYYTFTFNGVSRLNCKINVSGIEPLTGEKIWSKSVSIPDVDINIITQNAYYRKLNLAELLTEDPSVYNAIGKALQTQYNGILDKIAAHFNVEEFTSLKNQIRELKSKKGF